MKAINYYKRLHTAFFHTDTVLMYPIIKYNFHMTLKLALVERLKYYAIPATAKETFTELLTKHSRYNIIVEPWLRHACDVCAKWDESTCADKYSEADIQYIESVISEVYGLLLEVENLKG